MTDEQANAMVRVEAGYFLMGASDEDQMIDPNYPEHDDLEVSRPQRRVWVSAFEIDVHPVTNAQYQRFVDETGYPVPHVHPSLKTQVFHDPEVMAAYNWDVEKRTYSEGMGDYPVVLVSWYDAVAYCDWAGKRLPTEAEWEKAARGTDGRKYPWGNSGDPAEHCHCVSSQYGFDPVVPAKDLRPVDAYPSGVSPYGCYDMLGNVEEWCADWYDDEAYRKLGDRDPFNRIRLTDKWSKVTRGNSRFSDRWLHVAYRGAGSPWVPCRSIGFRCARSIE